jgi:hypothetical protein
MTDRDESIEQLLRRARTSDLSAPEDCPDTETLAAFADDALTAPMRREVESHVADCHRCQELTAAMARAGVGAGTPAASPIGDAFEKAAPWWAARPLRWLVPAAAAATAVALWVAIPDQRATSPSAPVSDVQELQRQDAAPEFRDQAAAPGSQDQVGAEAPAPERAAGAAAARNTAPSAAPSAAPATPPPPPPAASAPPAAGFGVSEQTPAAAGTLPTSRETPPAGVSAPQVEPRQQQPSAADRQNELARREAAQEPDAALDQQARSAPAPAAVGSVAGLRAAAPLEILSSNPRIRWRIGPGRVVQYSTDAGATWITQQTGAPVDLTAGSSPAPEVAWLAGRGGIVLRTTNAGRDWQRTAMPAPVDIVGVTAASALSATVTLADGRRLATADGGRTWNPAP